MVVIANNVDTTIEPPLSNHAPKMLSPDGRLREFRPYWVKLLPHSDMVTAETCFNSFLLRKLSRKNPAHPIEKFPSLVLPGNAIMLQHPVFKFSLYYLLNGRFREDKNKPKFQTFSFKSCHGR